VDANTSTLTVNQRIRDAVRDNPNVMTMQLARELGVPEVEVIRALPDGRAVELDAERWEELIRSFETLGTVHVIVTNGGATLESVGAFGNFSIWEEFFNVQTKTLDMHIRWPQLAAIFAVEKPSHMNGISTYSIQFFDRSGAAAFKVFLNFGGAVGAERIAAFNRLREQFRKDAMLA
jgi:putative heme utilization carrier protein HutX